MTPAQTLLTINRSVAAIFNAEPVNPSKPAGGVAYLIVRAVFLQLRVRYHPEAVALALKSAVDQIAAEVAEGRG